MRTLPDRTDLRSSLVTDLKLLSYVISGTTILPLADDTGSIPHVFGYFKKNPGGISPFACLDAGNVQYSTDGSSDLLVPAVIVIGFWVRRGEADEHDVILDHLVLGLVDMLRAKYNAKFASPSVSDYEVMDGISYKFELHFVEFAM